MDVFVGFDHVVGDDFTHLVLQFANLFVEFSVLLDKSFLILVLLGSFIFLILFHQ